MKPPYDFMTILFLLLMFVIMFITNVQSKECLIKELNSTKLELKTNVELNKRLNEELTHYEYLRITKQIERK